MTAVVGCFSAIAYGTPRAASAPPTDCSPPMAPSSSTTSTLGAAGVTSSSEDWALLVSLASASFLPSSTTATRRTGPKALGVYEKATSLRAYPARLTAWVATTGPVALPSWTVTTVLAALLPLENTGTDMALALPATTGPRPPFGSSAPPAKPGETSTLPVSWSTSSVTFSRPALPPSTAESVPSASFGPTFVNAQPVGFLDQVDQVSAAPEVAKPALEPPSNDTVPLHVPQAAKSPTVAVHLPATGRTTDRLSAPPTLPESTGPYFLPFGSTRVSVHTDVDDGQDRRLGGLTLTAYKLPRGTIASYYPECNVLVPIGHHDQLSKTPASKSVPVRVEAGT